MRSRGEYSIKIESLNKPHTLLVDPYVRLAFKAFANELLCLARGRYGEGYASMYAADANGVNKKDIDEAKAYFDSTLFRLTMDILNKEPEYIKRLALETNINHKELLVSMYWLESQFQYNENNTDEAK